MEYLEQLRVAALIVPTDTRIGNGERRQMSHLKEKGFTCYFMVLHEIQAYIR